VPAKRAADVPLNASKTCGQAGSKMAMDIHYPCTRGVKNQLGTGLDTSLYPRVWVRITSDICEYLQNR
jgi:hypothetical protein